MQDTTHTNGSYLLRLPDLQDRHTSNDGVGILLGGRVDGIVGANHQSQVSLCKVARQGKVKTQTATGQSIQLAAFRLLFRSTDKRMSTAPVLKSH